MHKNPLFPPHPIPKWYEPLMTVLLVALKNKNFKLKTASLAALAEMNQSATGVLLKSSQVIQNLVDLLPTTKTSLNYQDVALFQPYEDQVSSGRFLV